MPNQQTFADLLAIDPNEFTEKYQFDPQNLKQNASFNQSTINADIAANAGRARSEAFSSSKGIANSTFGEQLADQAAGAAREPYVQQQTDLMQHLLDQQFSADKFGAQLGFEQDKFKEGIRQYNEQISLDKKKWADSFGLDEDNFNEFVRQYDESSEDQREMFAQSLNFDREQFEESIRQFGIQQQFLRDQFGHSKRKDNADHTSDIFSVVLGTAAALLASDAKLKKNVATISNALPTINKMNLVSFLWKENNRLDYGVIAQQLAKVLPELVFDCADGIKRVNYQSLIAFSLKAVQELDARASKLEECSSLKVVQEFDSRLRKLEQQQEEVSYNSDSFIKKNDRRMRTLSGSLAED